MCFVFTTPSDAISIGIFLSPQTAQPHDFNWSKTRRSAKSYAETERLNATLILLTFGQFSIQSFVYLIFSFRSLACLARLTSLKNFGKM